MTAPTSEQVTKWAQEVGFIVRNEIIKTVHSNGSWVAVSERLTEFAALAYAAGQTAEREACAKVCEDFADRLSAFDFSRQSSANWCADLIRKRGDK